MVCGFSHWLPKKTSVTFDATERGMLEKLGRITGFSEEELIRKAVRKYYFGFTDGFYGRVMVDDISKEEIKNHE